MFRKKVGIAVLLSMVFSSYAFASEDNKGCFPKHIKIEGPPGTSILRLHFVKETDRLHTIKTSETSFDIIDQSDCNSSWGYNLLFLDVGTDAQHHSPRILNYYACPDKLHIWSRDNDVNFTLTKLDKISSTEYKLTYKNLT
jgi:hypothetical protein